MTKTLQMIVVGLSLGVFSAGCDSGDKAKPKTAAKGAADKGAADKGAADKSAADKGAADEGAADKATPDAEPAEQDLLAALDKRVTRVAKLAREIEKKPEDADNILEAADLDRAGFEDLIYTIGADPKLSKQYQLALADD